MSVVERAMAYFDEENKAAVKGKYLLSPGKNGGLKKGKGDDFWSMPGKTSDCVGFATACLGIRRFYKGFKLWGGYLNCNSICIDAFGQRAITGRGKKEPNNQLFIPSTQKAGALVIMPSKWANGKILASRKHGHVGVMVDFSHAVHCHGGTSGRNIRALDFDNISSIWKEPLFVELVAEWPFGVSK